MQPLRKSTFMRFSTGRLVLLAAWLISLAGAFGLGAYVYNHRTRIRPTTIRPAVPSVQPSRRIETHLYNLEVQLVAVPADGRDGGIAVKDILLQTIPSGVRILASHNHWYSEKDCYTLRVSSIETSFDGLMAATVPSNWKTVFESQPCSVLIQEANHRSPTHEAGGRLLPVSEREILITVGVFTGDAKEGPVQGPDVNSSYGKTILFNLTTGASRVFTRGHRNAQGLAATADRQIWLTEHGSRGGDELNRLVPGDLRRAYPDRPPHKGHRRNGGREHCPEDRRQFPGLHRPGRGVPAARLTT